MVEERKKQIPKSLEAQRATKIIESGSLFINIKHKIHRIKIEKRSKRL